MIEKNQITGTESKGRESGWALNAGIKKMR
jgi:hypothetical protein